jgi:hypothetical protein
MVARLPREARPIVRRTLRTGRVVMALALAVCGVAAAVAAITLAPPGDLPQMLPLAVLITFAARLAATARLRSPVTGRIPPSPRGLVNSRPGRRPHFHR